MDNSIVQHSMDQVHHEKERESFPDREETFKSLKSNLKSYKEKK